jgi:hypothetical protein
MPQLSSADDRLTDGAYDYLTPLALLAARRAALIVNLFVTGNILTWRYRHLTASVVFSLDMVPCQTLGHSTPCHQMPGNS